MTMKNVYTCTGHMLHVQLMEVAMGSTRGEWMEEPVTFSVIIIIGSILLRDRKYVL